MSVIQQIRDKYARWAVIAIALSLVGFLLMDAFAGRTGLFSNKQNTTLGVINGKTIEAQEFGNKLTEQEAFQQKQGMEITDDQRQQLINGLWDQEVNEVVMSKQYNELGLTVGDKELNDILYGANPPEDLKKGFTDPKTGIFNAFAAKQRLNAVLKSGTPDEKTQLIRYEAALKTQRQMSKYMGLLANTIYFPKWFLEKRNADNSYLSKVSYVNVPYTSIADSSVKISDAEIDSYVKEHKKDYEQKDETRSISYVSFSAAPSTADSAATKAQVESLKAQFFASKDPAAFLNQQGSVLPYYDGYQGKSKIQVPAKDSILALSKGAIYGPYLDQNNYVLAKMIDFKNLPDSAKARHILIQTNNPQTGQELLNDSIAKKRIDSIKTAIDNGARFDSLAKKFSDDKGSAEKGGLLATPQTEYFPLGQMVKAFNEFVFNGKPGERKIVKTEFGYHLVEILDQKNIEPSYKIAYLAKPITASNETDNAASNQASLFGGDSRDLKSFNENYDKNLKSKGINKLIASDIKPMDYTISGVQGQARRFVKSIFEAKKGDVIGPERVGDNYIVAIVTEVNEAGLEGASKVRTIVEPILRNKKKAEQITKNIGTVTTLEQAATKLNQQIQTVDSLRFNGGNNVLGYEPKVLGAVFNPSNKGKVVSEPLAGTQGVYIVRVDNVTTTPVEGAGLEQQGKMLEMQARQTMQYRSPIEVLRKSAEIKDYRSKFY
ncbi:MAG TPA: peptidylprolyl isomerase [Flavisolibacter sp.]|nr:peptidylprolyl isomerase [Flavisolibacter sp.]